MGDLLIWIILFLILVALICMVLYQLISLADLEFDHINPYDSASRINQWALPEIITQGVLCLFYLISGHWFMALLSAPYLYYNVTLYMQRKHLVDITEIFNLLDREKKRRAIKLGYLILLLLITVFRTIWSALEDDEHAL